MKKNSFNIEDKNLIDLFLDKELTEKNLAQSSLQAYKVDLKEFIFFINKNSKNLITFENKDFAKYTNYLMSKKLKVSTRIRKVSVISQLTNFLFLENYRSNNSLIKFTSSKKKIKIPDFMSEEDVTKILTYLHNNAKTFKDKKLFLMTEILYSTGIRVSELVSLEKSSITDDFKHIYIKGKGRKQRVLPLTKYLRKLLINYIKDLDRNINWLFPSRKKHYTRQAYFLNLKKVANKVGIDQKAISPHTLRHAFASHMLKNGADLKVIQHLLGHEDIATVQIYTHVNVKETFKAIKKHPLANTMLKE